MHARKTPKNLSLIVWEKSQGGLEDLVFGSNARRTITPIFIAPLLLLKYILPEIFIKLFFKYLKIKVLKNLYIS